MNEVKKTKDQLTEELAYLRRRVSELEEVVMQSQRDHEALRESEERFRSIFEGSLDSILLADPKTGEILDANPAAEELLLMSREEIIGLHQSQLHPPDLRGYEKAAFLRVVNEGSHQVPTESVVQSSDGRHKTVEILAQVIQIDGRPVVYGVFRDISVRKREEQVFAESRELLKKVFVSQLDPIFVLNSENPPKIVECNPAATKVFGYSREELLGRSTDFLHVSEEALAEFQSLLYPAISEQGFFYLPEFKMRTKDGTIFTSEHSIVQLLDERDRRIGWVSHVRDITKRIRAEEALRQSESRFRTLVEHARDVIYTLTTDILISSLSPAFEKVTGWSTTEWIGRPIEELIHPDDWPLVVEMGIRLLRGEKPPIHEARIRTKSSEYITAEFSIVEHMESEKLVGIIGIGRDITDRKRMEEELQKAQKIESLGILAGGIAHDFNNILTPILANISIARTFADFDRDIGEALTDAEKACLRAKGLTQQLLTFSKGGMPVKELVSICGLLKEETRFASSGSNVRWAYSVPEDLWWVEIDQGQMGQVIRNLIINAAQAMPEGGMARIEAVNVTLGPNKHVSLKEGKYVRIDISDNGVGIPPRHLPKIFDPFFSTKDKGSGLGLSISHTIVMRHQGSIEVESEMGKGTTFHIYLPASEKDRGLEHKDRPKALKGEGRILLIDDDEAIRRSAEQMLRRLGYDVESAKEGNEGLRLYRGAKESGRPFSAVIMDLTIPGGMGGRQTIKRLKEVEPAAKMIVSSGYSDDPVMARFKEHGFEASLKKPYTIGELAELVQKVVMERHE